MEALLNSDAESNLHFVWPWHLAFLVACHICWNLVLSIALIGRSPAPIQSWIGSCLHINTRTMLEAHFVSSNFNMYIWVSACAVGSKLCGSEAGLEDLHRASVRKSTIHMDPRCGWWVIKYKVEKHFCTDSWECSGDLSYEYMFRCQINRISQCFVWKN